ncbi:hypothetical protein HLB44_09675 [Aquincola sp. S2]|uniref:CheW-like domain-containing protein n=1 Tax=Pseudaquabacterium terrae TaxID=2732868 RepID=A0ABX2EF83_9BURK|nr:hypothetical protein [Aquabacterium terrae]NRF67251.1 hypothetical protein [Aquabacterium terrae]
MQAVTLAHSPALAASEVAAPEDAALHTATLQAAARPQAVVSAEAPRAPDAAQPAADLANGFALPADQLMPVTLIGLQVHPGDAWPMARQAETPASRRDEERDEPRAAKRDPDPIALPDDPLSDDTAAYDAPAGVEIDNGDAAQWQDPLARAINERLAAPQPPAALRAAAEHWSRARCVVLVCPQADDTPGSAWAFVLWPRPMPRPRGPMAGRVAFSGQRFPAHLQWAADAPARAWCQVRAIKEHHPRGGRRLVALDSAGAPLGAVPCELQLGPVRIGPPRWRQAGVRIDAVRRFWTALGGQWSVLVLVSPQPLLGPQAPLLET